MRWCPGAADFLVQWEDMSPKVLAFAEKRSNPMVKVLLDELKEFSSCTQSEIKFYATLLYENCIASKHQNFPFANDAAFTVCNCWAY